MIDFQDLTINNNPWPHVVKHKHIDPLVSQSLIQYIKNYDKSQIPNEDRQNGIITCPIDKNTASSIHRQLENLHNKKFHHDILNFWSVDSSNGYSHSVNWDLCEAEGSNGWHCDLGNTPDTCDVITLQWYLDQPQHSRTLRLKIDQQIIDAHTLTGSFVMFKSHPCTFHGFESGTGNRLSLRLRLKTKLISPTHIHHPDSSDSIGVIIDCKNMDSPKNLEHSLGNFTRLNLKYHNWHNICVIDHHTQFETARNTLLGSGVKKLLVLFAGSIVSSWSKQCILDLPNTFWAHKTTDRIYRKYLVIPSDNQTQIQQQQSYGANILSHTQSKHNHELGIYYVHPEQKTIRFLDKIQKFMLPEKENIDHPEADVYTNWISTAQKSYF